MHYLEIDVFPIRVGHSSKLRNPDVVAHDRLSPVVDNGRPEQREVSLVVLRKMLVEILRSDELKHCVAKKLHALVGAKSQVGRPNRPVDGFIK